jgi:hypothetical protein
MTLSSTQRWVRLAAAGMNSCFVAVHRWFSCNELALNRTNRRQSSAALTPDRCMRARSARSSWVTLKFQLRDVCGRWVLQSTKCCPSISKLTASARRRYATSAPAQHTATDHYSGCKGYCHRSNNLDYCNSLLFGTSAPNIRRLQRVPSSLARLVCQGGPGVGLSLYSLSIYGPECAS